MAYVLIISQQIKDKKVCVWQRFMKTVKVVQRVVDASEDLKTRLEKANNLVHY